MNGCETPKYDQDLIHATQEKKKKSLFFFLKQIKHSCVVHWTYLSPWFTKIAETRIKQVTHSKTKNPFSEIIKGRITLVAS